MTALRPERYISMSVYSNFDHELDDDVVGELEKGGCHAAHAAWNFNGSVWFDPEDGQWYEEVWVHGSPVEQFHGATIMDVIQRANIDYGMG